MDVDVFGVYFRKMKVSDAGLMGNQATGFHIVECYSAFCLEQHCESLVLLDY